MMRGLIVFHYSTITVAGLLSRRVLMGEPFERTVSGVFGSVLARRIRHRCLSCVLSP